jgi:transcription-repair coupling factor (superfamily II helicase)
MIEEFSVNLNALQKFQLDQIAATSAFQRLQSNLSTGQSETVISGLAGSSLAYLLTALARKSARPVLVISSGRERAEELMGDLEFFGVNTVYHFPAWENLPYEPEEPHTEIAARQLDAYGALLRIKKGEKWQIGEAPVILAPVDALFQKLLSHGFYGQKCFRIGRGEAVNLDSLSARLINAGYERTAVVETRGEFSIRGGIVDIFTLTHQDPIRLDLIGREVESIRHFDPYTQRSFQSKESLEEIIIPPARLSMMLKESVNNNIPLVTIFDYLSGDTIIFLDDRESFKTQSEHFEQLAERQYFEVSAKGEEVIPPMRLYTNWETLATHFERYQIVSHSLLPVENGQMSGLVRFQTASFQDVRPSLDYYLDVLKTRQARGYHINVVCDNEGQLQRFDELLREREVSAATFINGALSAGAILQAGTSEELREIVLSIGGLHEGFMMPDARVLFITDREIFGRYKRRHVYRRIYKGEPVSAPSEFRRGDYVVHVEHGIGQFLGIRTQMIDGHNVDLLEILYAEDTRLLVPVDKIRYIQKYSIMDNLQPPLDELGSKAWLARRKKTETRIAEMAEELLNLYARRKIAGGYAYNPDTVWQSEFESSFIYEETPDQITAIEQVKRDLETLKPMDRLVCGDVAYGKTEVAIRAAFKVAQEGKQVTLLAPTTILSQQHYNTFSERFAEYPFKVEMLSRFRTHSEQKKILERLKNGEISIIIGTHRLLSKDVEFCDLGLVIVDEEQRFGVRHKERLKELRTSVDFLTLTATPIPRTLYMALSGLRDLSIINTPPPNRLPIRTKIIHWDDELIRESLLREMNRSGQIFFVHNRIQTIEQVARHLLNIVPELKIGVAHGRLNEHELEQVMVDFIDKKYDLLLSTTIIENGLDIPNVNTIIINRADAFGLAQLYQLRGRVGRDVKQAYAYLITPTGEPITNAAVRRLAAIEEFTELGVGFNIAMRDLEIRGSGNLLGKEQHGCIISVGFDLYCSLLEKTVKHLKGEPVEEDRPVEIKWSVEAYLPSDYIPVESQRVGIYKRLSEARTLEQIRDIREEMRDRYGELHKAAENLLKISSVRVLAIKMGLRRVILTPNGFKLTANVNNNVLALSEKLKTTARELGERASVTIEDENTLHVQYPNWGRQPRLDKALRLLGSCPVSSG